MLNLIAAYDKLILAVNKNIKSLKVYPKILSEPHNQKFHLLFDKCLYIALIQNDLIIGLKYLDVSNALKNQIEANYFARIVALNSYEALNYFDKLIGKNVQSFLTNAHLNQEIKEINDTGKKINTFKKSCFKYLDDIRNNVIGHKDANSLKQTTIMLQIDNKKIHSIGTSLYKLNFELLDNYMKLMKKCISPLNGWTKFEIKFSHLNLGLCQRKEDNFL